MTNQKIEERRKRRSREEKVLRHKRKEREKGEKDSYNREGWRHKITGVKGERKRRG